MASAILPAMIQACTGRPVARRTRVVTAVEGLEQLGVAIRGEAGGAQAEDPALRVAGFDEAVRRAGRDQQRVACGERPRAHLVHAQRAGEAEREDQVVVGGGVVSVRMRFVEVLMSDEHRPVSPGRDLRAGGLVLRDHGERSTP